MKNLLGVVLLAGLLSGCLIRTHDNHRTSSRHQNASCPPAHHWNGARCEHNGRHRGHDKRR